MTRDPEIRRCFQCLAQEFDPDDVFGEFQQDDPDGKGSLKKADTGIVAEAFLNGNKNVDYTSFCHQLQNYVKETSKPSGDVVSQKRRSTTDSTQSSDEPTRSRRHRMRGKHENESDVAKRSIRVDYRLEKHRVIKASIRHKILHGVKKSTSNKEGFDGIRDLLLHEDGEGQGMLDEPIFVATLLENMRVPLTKAEMSYLTVNLRNKKHTHCINYEHIGHFLCVDSDEEVSTSGDEATTYPLRSPSKNLEHEPHLGSDVLSIERNLKSFFNQRVPREIDLENPMNTCCHTPRSIFIGAEKFVEACELFDPLEVGSLAEDGYEKALQYCGMTMTHAQLRSVLAKFPRDSRGLISYVAFLERYGHHLATVKHRRHMKVILQRLATEPDRLGTIQQCRRQLEKIDSRVTGAHTGYLSKKEFVSCLTSHNCKWPRQDLEACLSLFIEPSKKVLDHDARVVCYPEFLRLVEFCTAPQAIEIPCQCHQSSLSNMEALHQRLNDFLHDQSRGVGTRGRDIALHAFESADKMRSPHGSLASYLTEGDFFTVLRTIGIGVSPAEKQLLLHHLSNAGYITPQGIHYPSFLRLFEAPAAKTLSPRHPVPSRHSPSKVSFDENICIGTYLAEYATNEERSNFEHLMETFKSFQVEKALENTSNELVYQLGPVLKVSVQFFT